MGQLGLSENTMRNHVAALYRKIGVNRRTAAIIWARERGITGRDGIPPLGEAVRAPANGHSGNGHSGNGRWATGTIQRERQWRTHALSRLVVYSLASPAAAAFDDACSASISPATPQARVEQSRTSSACESS